MMQRQTSFRLQLAPTAAATANSPFKRNLSLRLNELPSTLERQRLSASTLGNVPEIEGADDHVSPAGGIDNKSADASVTSQSRGERLLGVLLCGNKNQSMTCVSVLPIQVLKSQINQLYQISEEQRALQGIVVIPNLLYSKMFLP
jgi:hypothetical protein